MEKPKRTYTNAGMQTRQGLRELRMYGDADPMDFLSLKCISEVMGVRKQMLIRIPVQRHMIDKRAYYRKGDIEAWLEEESKKPDGLLAELRAEHAKTKERMQRHPSRRYVSGQPAKAKPAKAKSRSDGASVAALNWLAPATDKSKG